jgi:hypothetical protein
MKRGFLNTQKAKKRVAEAARSESTGQSHKKFKDKERYVTTTSLSHAVDPFCCSDDSGSRTERVAVDLTMLDPHKLPEHIKAQYEDKSRVIFRIWPRDPNGKPIKPSPLRGKEAGNGLDLWGATLYDFYRVHRMPDVIHYVTTSTGSRLAKWMRQAGELIAKDELAWADQEEDPKEIPVADMGELITCRDLRVALGMYNRFSSRKEVRDRAEGKPSVSPSQGASHSASESPEPEAKEDSTPPLYDVAGTNQEGEGVRALTDRAEETVATGEQFGEPMQVDEAGERLPEKGADQQTDEPTASPSKYDLDSPFNPAHYPSPWPFIPCTNDDRPPILQQRIPLHLLPQKLHVHDPWNHLSIDEGDDDIETPWLTKVTDGRDIVRTYSLSLSDEGKKAALAARQKAELLEVEAATKETVMRIFPPEKQGPTEEPLIEVVLPPRPKKRTQVEEAHLYFAPPAVGKGHHSIVYFAEWELPRDLFIEPRLCKVCIEEDARKQLRELKDRGKWDQLLEGLTEKPKETTESGLDASGPELSHTSPKRTVGHITIEEHSLPHETVSFHNANDLPSPEPLNTKDGEITDSNDSVTSGEDSPADIAIHVVETGNTEVDVKMDVVEEQDAGPGHHGEPKEVSAEACAPGESDKETLEQDNGDEEKADEEQHREELSEDEIFTIHPPRIVRVAAYTGPALRIHTTVKWQDPSGTKCIHGSIGSSNPVPRTATVGVVAKLSVQHDRHLEREAKNYQQFPSHFFEHWNGYNVIPPLHDPVPVGAVCPQFYGYYTPDDPTDGTSHPDYLSAILLLEYCGKEINPEELNKDDRQECASVLFRFHHAGWLHESFAQRNLMWQQGRPTEWPIQRPRSQHKSFRLIDFGRSMKIENSLTRMSEEEQALQLLRLHHYG